MDVEDLYRIFYPTATEYMFFILTHATFSKLNHIVGPNTILNKFKNSAKMTCILIT
jgi:hypothetical protein